MSEEPRIQITPPDAPYCVVALPLVKEVDTQAQVQRAVEIAAMLNDAYVAQFGANRRQQSNGAPAPGKPAQRPPNAPPSIPDRVWGMCPDHPSVQAVPSAPQYQEYDFDEQGNQIPAKFYCPGNKNGTGKNHSIWRSKLLPVAEQEEEPSYDDEIPF